MTTRAGPFRPGSGRSHPVTATGQSAPVFGQCSIERRTKEGPCWCGRPRYFVTAIERGSTWFGSVLLGSAGFGSWVPLGSVWVRLLVPPGFYPGSVLGFAGFSWGPGSLVRRVLRGVRSKSRSRPLGLARASRHHVVGDDAAADLRTRCRRASSPGHHRTVHDSIRWAIVVERSRAPDPGPRITDPALRMPEVFTSS